MTPIAPEKTPRLRVLTRLDSGSSSDWLSPLGHHAGVDTWVHDVPLARAWRSFTLHLFAPATNLFLVGVLTAIPFVVPPWSCSFTWGPSLASRR